MAIPLFLAMTGWEISKIEELPRNIAWMACHFSPYTTGLSNLPPELPPSAMVIVNDFTPVGGHDPERIAGELQAIVEERRCGSVLLDFQRPGEPRTAAIAQAIVRQLPCPVGVSEPYAGGLSCPVFLPPVPPHIPMPDYLASCGEREIWLEWGLEGSLITVTDSGSTVTPLPHSPQADCRHREVNLFCHYDIELLEKQVQFRLHRSLDDLHALLTAVEGRNVTRTIGLYQELAAVL